MFPCFFGGIPVALVLELLERGDELRRVSRGLNDLVDEAARRGDVRIRELLAELRHLLGARALLGSAAASSSRL